MARIHSIVIFSTQNRSPFSQHSTVYDSVCLCHSYALRPFIVISSDIFTYLFTFLCSNSAATPLPSLVIVRSIKIIRKLFQWVGKKAILLNKWMFCRHFHTFRAKHFNFIDDTVLFAFSFLFLIKTHCTNAFSFFLMPPHTHTHRITKYNHYKRIIHFKLLEPYRLAGLSFDALRCLRAQKHRPKPQTCTFACTRTRTLCRKRKS